MQESSSNQVLQYTYLESGSYPPELILDSGVEHSQIHKLIRQNPQIIQFPILYRQCTLQDIPEINLLFQQWFPMNYSKQLYDCFTKTIKCHVATLSGDILDQKTQLIVGIVTWKMEEQNQFLQKQSIFEYITPKYQDLYIMSLGVINELRGKGIAKKLMRIVEEEAAKNTKIKSLSLHVLDTNVLAFNFYQKLGFEYLKFYRFYYCFEGRYYAAKYYVKFINGGKKVVEKWWKKRQNHKLGQGKKQLIGQ